MVLIKIFPDSNPDSDLNISKYITHKGKTKKILIRKTTMKTFLDKLESAIEDIIEHKKQSKLDDFHDAIESDTLAKEISSFDWNSIFPDESSDKD